MSKNGLLIDYGFCTGCHACEVACKSEHGFAPDQWGIKVVQLGPWELEEDKWEYDFVPIPTDLCDLCEERVSMGKLPTCVHHCQAMSMQFGPVEELAAEAAQDSKMVLFIPR